MKEVKVKLFELTRMLPQLPDCHQKRWIERLQKHPSTVPGMELFVPAEQVDECKRLVEQSRSNRKAQAEKKADGTPDSVHDKDAKGVPGR